MLQCDKNTYLFGTQDAFRGSGPLDLTVINSPAEFVMPHLYGFMFLTTKPEPYYVLAELSELEKVDFISLKFSDQKLFKKRSTWPMSLAASNYGLVVQSKENKITLYDVDFQAQVINIDTVKSELELPNSPTDAHIMPLQETWFLTDWYTAQQFSQGVWETVTVYVDSEEKERFGFDYYVSELDVFDQVFPNEKFEQVINTAGSLYIMKTDDEILSFEADIFAEIENWADLDNEERRIIKTKNMQIYGDITWYWNDLNYDYIGYITFDGQEYFLNYFLIHSDIYKYNKDEEKGLLKFEGIPLDKKPAAFQIGQVGNKRGFLIQYEGESKVYSLQICDLHERLVKGECKLCPNDHYNFDPQNSKCTSCSKSFKGTKEQKRLKEEVCAAYEAQVKKDQEEWDEFVTYVIIAVVALILYAMCGGSDDVESPY